MNHNISETPDDKVSDGSALLPRRITALSSEVIDQIAAGEVVERPAHLVKELIENSIDAAATEVDIDFEDGGRFVRVTDNGIGICGDDLGKAVARHATSKISKADDLWALSSYGFRGEALASIAAVSELELRSRPRSEEVAQKVGVRFGLAQPLEPCSGNFGTSVLIDKLFENIPARLKFMKSESAEGAQIRLVVKAMALANPGVSFRLRTKGRLDLSFVVQANESERERWIRRAEEVLSVKLHLVEGEFEGFRVRICFSGPQNVVGNSKGLWIFVQNRWIQDRSLQAAVIESYRGLLMHGEFPLAVVQLLAPEGEVDVNIHPTKSAVKFRDPSRAFRAVSRTLRGALEKAPWMDEGGRGSALGSGVQAAPATRGSVGVADAVRAYAARNEQPKEQEFSKAPPRWTLDQFVRSAKREGPASSPLAASAVDNLATPSRAQELVPSGHHWSRLVVLGQAKLTYLVCQDHDRLVIVDQHAAHERVAYERLTRAWSDKTNKSTVESQGLLIPLLVDLDPELVEVLLSAKLDLQRVGIELDSAGPRTVSIASIPTLLKADVVEGSLREMASALSERGGSHVFEEKIGHVFATMACHSVVRAGQSLSLEQMNALLEQMDEFPLSSFCPHGRPVSVEYPFAKLERDFGRIV